MSLSTIGMIIGATAGSITALFIYIIGLKNKATKLKREKDVETIKTEALQVIHNTDIKHLLDKLNRRTAIDAKRSDGDK